MRRPDRSSCIDHMQEQPLAAASSKFVMLRSGIIEYCSKAHTCMLFVVDESLLGLCQRPDCFIHLRLTLRLLSDLLPAGQARPAVGKGPALATKAAASDSCLVTSGAAAAAPLGLLRKPTCCCCCCSIALAGSARYVRVKTVVWWLYLQLASFLAQLRPACLFLCSLFLFLPLVASRGRVLWPSHRRLLFTHHRSQSGAWRGGLSQGMSLSYIVSETALLLQPLPQRHCLSGCRYGAHPQQPAMDLVHEPNARAK